MELTGAIRVHALQLVVISDSILHVLVEVAVASADDAIPLAGDEGTDVDVLAGLRRTAVQVKAGVVYLAGHLPLQARCGQLQHDPALVGAEEMEAGAWGRGRVGLGLAGQWARQ